MDKEVVVHIQMEYYSAIERKAFKSAIMRWMNLKPIIQREVNQKEKGKYHIITHIYGIQRDGTDDPIYRAAKGDADKKDRLLDRAGEGKGGMM